MQNTIRYYYNFDQINIMKVQNGYFVKEKGKKYIFMEVQNNENVVSTYEITKMYPEYEKIVLNRNKSIFTPYKNKIYVLIERKNIGNQLHFTTRKLPFNSKFIHNVINWDTLWCKKIDYYEYQANHIKGIYRSIDESIWYFIGLAETAISYFQQNNSQKQTKNTICRKRMIKGEYYNPLNVIIDNQTRDIGEYIKMLFWQEEYNSNKIEMALNTVPKSPENFILVYSRVLYPSYYFDEYENIINNKATEEKMTAIISKIDKYEEYIRDVYIILKKYNSNIPKIDWI